MAFIDIPTEQTTAATDAVLALVAVACMIALRRHRSSDPFKVKLWSWTFGLLALAAVLGAIAHGFQTSAALRDLLWQPLNLSLGLAVALFCLGAFRDMWGRRFAKRALPVMIGLGVVFYAVTRMAGGAFFVFIIYEAAAMLTALAVYTRLAAARLLAGAWLMAGGVLVSIVAAALQAGGSVRVTLIWPFDHNGVFHLVQIVGILILTAGLKTALAGSGRQHIEESEER
ncbi:MAG: DUF6962 family protein [Desulfobacterales bacterium]